MFSGEIADGGIPNFQVAVGPFLTTAVIKGTIGLVHFLAIGCFRSVEIR